jgi:predicted small lipoprotein YifL
MVFRRSAALMLIAGIAACGDSTGPEDFSPSDANAKAEAVLSAVSGNSALASLAVLGPYIQFSAAQAALSVAPFDPTEPQTTTTAARLQAIRAAGPSFGSSGSLALFPQDLLGMTLVFNTQTSSYEVDDARSGAPADGVRLILYAVDPILGQLVTPLNEIGYLDLIDVSTVSVDALQLVAVIGTTTYLDYTASVTQTTSSATVAAEGYLSDGTHQVDFDLSLSASISAVSLDYLLSAGGNSVRLEGTLTGGGDDNVDVRLTVQGDGDTVVLTYTVTPSTLSGEITYNGDVAIDISGTPDSPVFARPDGTPLTQQELNALQALGDIVEEIFDAFDNLLGPALLVFVFG